MVKKMLSLCIALIFVLQLFTVVVHAAPSLTVKVEVFDAVRQILKISGTVSNDTVRENRLVTVVATPKNGAVSESTYSTYLAFGYAEVEENGNYEFQTGFSHPLAEYDFHVIYDTVSAKTTFKYIPPSTLASLVREIRDSVIPTNQLYTSILNYANGLEIDINVFSTVDDKAVLEYRVDASRANLIGITDSDIIEDFNEILEFAKNECDFLDALHSITYSGEYYNYLYTNNEYPKINFTAYNALNDTQRDYVTTAFIGQKFSNADEVKSFFDTKVSEAPTNSVNGSTITVPGIGGGFGGGAGGSYIPPSNDRVVDGSDNTAKEEIKIKFKDISSVSWAAEAITKLYEAGIVNGVTENEYEPNGLVTREQFAKLLAVTLKIYDKNAVCDFSDSQNDWYSSYVASVKNAGLINGVGDNLFGVGRNISRQDMAVMIYNALKFKSVELKSEKTDFTDFDQIAPYAQEAVKFLVGNGIINGMSDGSFGPNDNATRAQAAVLIYALKGRVD